MLGRLEMGVDEAIERYLDFMKHVFGKKKWWLSDGKYMATRLEEAIDMTVGGFPQQGTKLRVTEAALDGAERCKTYVPAGSSSSTL
jgi:hypothetical protein